MATTLASGIDQRMLDRMNSPTFLVEHQVVQDASDRKLGVILDGIVFEVFVPSIAIDQILPIRVPASDLFAKGQAHRGCLDIERLIVFGDMNRPSPIEFVARYVEDFMEHLQAALFEKFVGLLGILGTLIDAECEGLEPLRGLSPSKHQMVEYQEHRAAIDPSGKEDTDGFLFTDTLEPSIAFGGQLPDVLGSDRIEIVRPSIALGLKETGVKRVRIGASDKFDLDDIVGRNHSGVRCVELIVDPHLGEFEPYVLDLLGDDQAGALGSLGQEIPHGPPDRACHSDGFSLGDADRKLTIDLGHLVGESCKNHPFCLFDVHIQENIGIGIHKVFNACNGLGVRHRLEFLAEEVMIRVLRSMWGRIYTKTKSNGTK